MKPQKPLPGDIWQTPLGGYVLVSGGSGGHVVVCPVAVRPDGSVVSHPRGRKAESLLETVFARFLYVGVAKPRTGVAA